MSEAKDVFDGLRATFDLGEHELRPLIAKDNFTQWSVYIRREAITNRLDELFGPFEWDFEINQRVDKGGYVVYNGAIVIKGRRRANNGGASGSDENTEKAALTDCFKRCASSWGIGLYLQNTPRIATGPIGKTEDKKFRVNYAQQADMEAEALCKFGEWWATLSGETVTTPAPAPTAAQAKAKLEGSKTRKLEDKPAPTNKKPAAWTFTQKAETDLMFETKDTDHAGQERMNTLKKMKAEGAFNDCTNFEDAKAAFLQRLAGHREEVAS